MTQIFIGEEKHEQENKSVIFFFFRRETRMCVVDLAEYDEKGKNHDKKGFCDVFTPLFVRRTIFLFSADIIIIFGQDHLPIFRCRQIIII